MKIRFTDTIEPILLKKSLRAKEAGKNFQYTLNSAVMGKDVFTRHCNSCTSVLLNSNNYNYLAHIDPQNFNVKNFAKAFEKIVDNFQYTYGDIKAIILGGWEISRKDPFVKTPSSIVYSTIANILDNVPLTMICGKKEGMTAFDNLFASKDTVTIANNNLSRLVPPKKQNVEELENQLGKNYEWVEIEPDMLNG